MASLCKGTITKGVGGLYAVEAADTAYLCRARGLFRKQGVSPVAGDWVRISVQEDGSGWIEEILPRRSILVRPPVANADCLAVVVSTAEPSPRLLIADKMLAIAEYNGLEPLVVVTKADLEDTAALERIYRLAGIDVLSVSVRSGRGVKELRARLAGRLTVFTGNSGVGKSSLFNALAPGLSQKTGEISRKLGRGRHTTRTTELFTLEKDTRLADTPGFSSLEMARAQRIPREELAYCFREFRPYLTRCRFTSCSHMVEDGCAVLEAVQTGKISAARHDSYRAIYEEIKDFKAWKER